MHSSLRGNTCDCFCGKDMGSCVKRERIDSNHGVV